MSGEAAESTSAAVGKRNERGRERPRLLTVLCGEEQTLYNKIGSRSQAFLKANPELGY